ncbi:MAG: response regulator transcription factor [Saprospiraceae bacterium]|nr:response regulator transcription factor [Saprospiraceae bacterium]
MKALIIEDEPLAVDKLIGLLQRYDPNIEVLGPIDTVEEAVEWFAGHAPPDLLFLDIHLADGSSFEIFEQIEVPCPIIFTTAYDQYAIRAFKTKSIDYLLKPVKFEDLEAALEKFKELFAEHPQPSISQEMRALASLIQSNLRSYKTRFLVKAGQVIKSISIAEVAYFLFEDRNTLLVTKGNRRYPVKHTLDELEELLDPEQFNRANRQFIIGIDAIHKIHPWFKGRLKLDLSPPQEVDLVVSADKTKAFKEWLGW